MYLAARCPCQQGTWAPVCKQTKRKGNRQGCTPRDCAAVPYSFTLLYSFTILYSFEMLYSFTIKKILHATA